MERIKHKILDVLATTACTESFTKQRLFPQYATRCSTSPVRILAVSGHNRSPRALYKGKQTKGGASPPTTPIKTQLSKYLHDNFKILLLKVIHLFAYNFE